MAENKQKGNFIQKNGKLGAIIGAAWIALNIVLPLTLLRIPAVQDYLVTIKNKLQFNLPGIG